MSYSQNGEHIIIGEYFGDRKGILLDIGANDGITFSNSISFIEQGWYATLIEPSLAFQKLQEFHRGNNKVHCEKLCISNFRGNILWYELRDSLLSTKNKDIADSWRIPYEVSEIPCVPFADIPFHYTHRAGYNFITIDAEGSDWDILKQIHLENVECVCIEYGQYEKEIKLYCYQYGMRLLHKNGENMIFVK